MTFNEIQREVMDRMNLTSTDAASRVGREINEIYKRVTSSIGLITSRRVMIDVDLDASAIDSTLPEFDVTPCEKILRITINFPDQTIRVLKELTYDDVTNLPAYTASASASPNFYAIKRMGPQTVTAVIDAYPTDPFTLHVEGYDLASTLSDDQEPFMPEDFHDLIVEGVMSIELRKMEKPSLAQISEQRYNERLSDLRMFISKSAYQDIVQGINKPGFFWQMPWYGRYQWAN